MTHSSSALAIGVDLGSTAIKAGILDRNGRLTGFPSWIARCANWRLRSMALKSTH